eukprot:1346914-Prymnesium_polylepis.1
MVGGADRAPSIPIHFPLCTTAVGRDQFISADAEAGVGLQAAAVATVAVCDTHAGGHARLGALYFAAVYDPRAACGLAAAQRIFSAVRLARFCHRGHGQGRFRRQW